MNIFNPFRTAAPGHGGGDQWFSVGLASSFPDLGLEEEVDGKLAKPRPCGSGSPSGNGNKNVVVPGCKAFHVPTTDSSKRTQVKIITGTDSNENEEETESASAQNLEELDLTDQVLVFQYRGKFHAIDHRCPHSSFPLSHGTPFDIEDFGIVLSAGITCPKHGWSFDLFSGMGDRGNYRLKVWETQLRDVEGGEKEVWVRRKQRMG